MRTQGVCVRARSRVERACCIAGARNGVGLAAGKDSKEATRAQGQNALLRRANRGVPILQHVLFEWAQPTLVLQRDHYQQPATKTATYRLTRARHRQRCLLCSAGAMRPAPAVLSTDRLARQTAHQTAHTRQHRITYQKQRAARVAVAPCRG